VIITLPDTGAGGENSNSPAIAAGLLAVGVTALVVMAGGLRLARQRNR
jgi:hypothetical protein